MKQEKEIFSEADIKKAKAIVRVFETGDPHGNYAAVAVLNDGAGISYGVNQFTHRSGSLRAVIEKYLAAGGAVGRKVIVEKLPLLKRNDVAAIKTLAADAAFKKALQAAAITREMREVQESVGEEMYLRPAIDACRGSGFVLPLSLAVVYDSMIHGSYAMIRDRVKRLSELGGELAEKTWITEYVRQRDVWLGGIARLRATRYRTRFFIGRIAIGEWHLSLPMTVHGVRLTNEILQISPVKTDEARPVPEPKTPTQKDQMNKNNTSHYPLIPASDPRVRKPADLQKPAHKQGRNEVSELLSNNRSKESVFEAIERKIDHAAAQYDRAERLAYSVTTRTDRAKSLWTTVAATIWQTVWAVFGIAAGLPREVWFVTAVIAGAVMLFYLYRQISLGRIRERMNAE